MNISNQEVKIVPCIWYGETFFFQTFLRLKSPFHYMDVHIFLIADKGQTEH